MEYQALSVITNLADSIENPHLCNWEVLFGHPGQRAQYINLHDARELINAYSYLSQVLRPTLVHLTIRWDRSTSFVARDWLDYQGQLLEKMGRWLMRNRLPVAFLWVREHGWRAGPHTHLLLHLPPQHWSEFMKFMMVAGGFDQSPDPAGTALKLSAGRFGMRTAKMQTSVLRYMLKTVDPRIAVRQPAASGGTTSLPVALGIDSRSGDDVLPIYGKRVGTSYSLGPTMRRNFGWKSIHTAAELRAALRR